MKHLTKKTQKILEFCADYDFEIVSYGIAPNPNGFCFEAPEKASQNKIEKLSKMFDSLDGTETQQLRKYIFG